MIYDLVLDDFVGSTNVNARDIQKVLDDKKDQEVFIKINSLGGSVFEAASIYTMIEQHGNVVVDLVGFNASAATVLTLGAKKIRMHANAMYLIHKAKSLVSYQEWMNEDDMHEVIKKIENEKIENEKITNHIAELYVKKSKKSKQDIYDLMEKETWLNATEALNMGFVDEIFEGGDHLINLEETKKMINAVGLPLNFNFDNISNMSNTNDMSNVNTINTTTMEYDKGKEGFFVNYVNKTRQFFRKKENGIDNCLFLNEIVNKEDLKINGNSVTLSFEEYRNINTVLEKLTENYENELSVLKTEFENFKNSAGAKTTLVNKASDNNISAKAANLFGTNNKVAEEYVIEQKLIKENIL